jgi:betaine-aldehyde dehydrogenase
MLKKICHSYINGTFTHADNNLHPNMYPATNETINQIAYASENEITQAIESSQHAFKTWSQTSINQRSAILLKTAELLRSKVKELAELEVWDTGKPIREASSVDIYSAADSLEYFAKIALGYESHVIPDNKALIYTTHEPLGVCIGIGAWNYPLQIACWKAAPALMMGNTMIYKPSELTPMTTLALAKIFQQAGLPDGVFNVILGDGLIAEKLLQQDHIAKVSFTGSVETGKKILQQTATQLIPTTLELGGKSPLIIFEDANLEQAILGAMFANFYTQGEICSNGTRVFVARNIYTQFIEKLIEQTKKLIIGDPFAKDTQIGALISRAHFNKVMNFIAQGKKEGAELALGGNAIKQTPLDKGNFIEPTIFVNCNDHMTIVKEEIFGPIMSILAFDDENEVITRANQTRYGLAAGIFTENLKRAHRVAKQLQAGVCWVNNYNITPLGMPFGGYKQSGLGRENGKVALSYYSQLKSTYIELNEIAHF